MTLETDELDKMLAAARETRDLMPADLTRRMLADAEQVQSEWRAPRKTPATDTLGLWHRLLAIVGGWPGLGGMVAACATGVWIGVSPPDFLPDPASLVYQTTSETETLGYYGLADAMSEEG